MLMALETGAVEFICTDIPTAKGAVAAYDDMVILDFTDTEDNFQVDEGDINIGISLKKGNTELKDAINSLGLGAAGYVAVQTVGQGDAAGQGDSHNIHRGRAAEIVGHAVDDLLVLLRQAAHVVIHLVARVAHHIYAAGLIPVSYTHLRAHET